MADFTSSGASAPTSPGAAAPTSPPVSGTTHPPAAGSTPLPVALRTTKTAATAASERFRPNAVEKAWIIRRLVAGGAPVQKMKTHEKTCLEVANAARNRYITDQQLYQEHEMYGMALRKVYMRNIKSANVQYIASTVTKLTKALVVVQGEDGQATVRVREGQREGGALQNLDEAVLEWKMEVEKNKDKTEDDVAKAMNKQKESRKEKMERLERRKREYAKVKNAREEAKKARRKEEKSSMLQNLKAQTLTANAAAASVAISAKQCEQFGALLQLIAMKNGLPIPAAATQLPPTFTA